MIVAEHHLDEYFPHFNYIFSERAILKMLAVVFD